MVRPTVARRSDADQIAALLDSPEISQLVTDWQPPAGRVGPATRSV